MNMTTRDGNLGDLVRFYPAKKVNGWNGSRRRSGSGRDEAEEDPGGGDGVSGEVFDGGGDGSGRARAPATGSGDGGGGAPPGRRRRTRKTAGGRRARRARWRAALEIGRWSTGRRRAGKAWSGAGGGGAPGLGGRPRARRASAAGTRAGPRGACPSARGGGGVSSDRTGHVRRTRGSGLWFRGPDLEEGAHIYR